MIDSDRIIKVNIEEEMKSSYIDYSNANLTPQEQAEECADGITLHLPCSPDRNA